MNQADALRTLDEYYDKSTPSEDDEFKYTESLTYLINVTGNPRYMCELAWHYGSQKRFDLEIKYLDLAAESGYLPAMEELGYMWYYGQHGEQDYEKAFYYFSKGAEADSSNGSLWCRYKLADMYRYGCAVEKDEEKYREMIEAAYEDVKNPQYLNDPFPEICLRLAGIRNEDGRRDDAIKLLRDAKRFMAERLIAENYWGSIEVMGRIIRYLYQLTPFDIEKADFYDLFFLTENIGKYTIKHRAKTLEITVLEENGERAIAFDGRWYRSFEDLCQKAKYEKKRVTSIADEFYDVEVVK